MLMEPYSPGSQGVVTLCIFYIKQINFREYQLPNSFQLDLEILKKLVRFGFASGLEIARTDFCYRFDDSDYEILWSRCINSDYSRRNLDSK